MAIDFVKRILPSWKNAALASLGAGLLILAFPDFEYWFMAWFALVPLMWAVERETSLQKPARSKGTDGEISGESDVSAGSGSTYSVRASATIRSFLLGWLFGTAFFFGTCWWLTYAPIHYAAFPWPLAYFLILIVCIGAGVFPAIFAAVLSVLLKRFGSWAFLAAPFVWVFSEFLRYWITGNNWNAIGYSQAFSWFSDQTLLPAQVGGAYLVGFSVVVFNLFVTSAFLSRREFREKKLRGEHLPVSEPEELVILDLSSQTVEQDEELRSSHPNSILWLSTIAYIYPIFGLFFLFVNVLHDYGKELKTLRIKSVRTLLAALVIPLGLSIFVWAVTTTPNLSYGMFSGGDAFVIAVQPNVPMSGLSGPELDKLREKQVERSKSAFEENLSRYQANDFGLFDNIADQEDADFARYRYAKYPRIVILPESPMNFMYNDDREFQQFVREFTTRNNVSLMFNSAEPDATNGKYFNSAVMVGPDGNEAVQYDKIFLLPFGEAVPPPLDGIMPGFVGNFSYGREYDLLPLGDAQAGVMICFESHFGQLSREYVRNGADVIIEMTNDGYLGPTPVLRQHLANAVFRAVETNRPVLRVTNVGITAYITEKGAVLDPTAAYQEDTRVWTVQRGDGSQTLYVRYGDWFAWLCSVVTIGLLILGIWRQPNRKSPVTMPIDPLEFWGTNYYNHPQLTDKMIRKAENKLGVKLPDELIALLRIQNGGYTKGFAFPMSVKTTWASDHVPLSELGGIVTDSSQETAQNLLDSSLLSTEWGVPERQVLLAGDGHFWITLDYRKGEVPSVAWIDTECGEDIQISPSFGDFLAGLVPSAEFVSADDYI